MTQLYRYVKYLSGNIFETHRSLLMESNIYVPTGTCRPFEKKMFVTVRGKILACERIDQKYVLGIVSENNVQLNFAEIANKYTAYYKSIKTLCERCARREVCYQCMFYISQLGEKDARCPGFTTNEGINKEIQYFTDILRKRPELYEKVIKEMLFEP